MASSGNFSTMNPLNRTTNNVVYSNGNLTTSPTSNWSTTTYCRSTTEIPKDKKIYVECRLDVQDGNYVSFGVATNFGVPSGNNVGGDGSVTIYESLRYVNGSSSSTGLGVASVGDILQVAIDGSNNKVWLGINNTWGNSGDPSNGTNESGTINTSSSLGYDITIVTTQNSNGTVTMNFGQDDTFGGSISSSGNTCANGGAFKYTPPTGFVSLSSKSLSISSDIDPAETDDDFPSKQCGVVTYTGTGSATTISGLGLQPDLIWAKTRSTSSRHYLVDSSRGFTKYLHSEDNYSEGTSSTGVTSANSDGFVIGGGLDYVNYSGRTFVAWCWRANGGVTQSNSNGSITATVQANTKAGFSIVTYTGNATNGATFGHGLSAKPSFVIIKNRNASQKWAVWHQSADMTDYKLLFLDTNSVLTTEGTQRWDISAISNSVFGLGSHPEINGSGADYVAYIWHDVEGYSKFGKYEGNANTDGAFVYTGFRIRILIIRVLNVASDGWLIYDTERETLNPLDTVLKPHDTASDYSNSAFTLDILSNGFKLRSSDNAVNGTSYDPYIYMAWGDSSFKYQSNTF